MSGGNQNYFCGCSCVLRLGHRMPPHILNGSGNAVPTRCISWTLLVFTKFCCESLWTRLTDNVAIFSGNTQCIEQTYVPPQSVCFVQDAVCLQQGSNQSTNPMANFGQVKTVVVKYSHAWNTVSCVRRSSALTMFRMFGSAPHKIGALICIFIHLGANTIPIVYLKFTSRSSRLHT